MERIVNFGHQAVHRTAVTAKGIPRYVEFQLRRRRIEELDAKLLKKREVT